MAWRLEIDGVDHTTDVRQSSGVSIELLRNEHSRAAFTCLPSLMPDRLSTVDIYAQDGGSKLFGGFILQRSVVGIQPQSAESFTRVECTGYSVYLDWCYVTLTYATDTTLQVVLDDLVAALPVSYGVTLDATDYSGVPLAAFSWVVMRASDALRSLGDRTGLSWAMTPAKVLGMAAFPVGVAPESFTDADPHCQTLSWDDPAEVAANTILLSCGPSGSMSREQSWTTVGSETTFVTDIPASGPGGYWLVNVTPPVGTAYNATVGTAPAMFGWDWSTHTLTSNIGAFAPGTILRFTYPAQYPFVVTATTGATPEIQYLASDETIVEPAVGQEKADQMLASLGASPRAVQATSLMHGWVPGQALTVSLAGRGVGASFAVTSVQIALETDTFWRYTIAAIEASAYAGSYLDEWRAMSGGGGGSSVAIGGIATRYSANSYDFDVRDFGAVGDGVADDTVAIQAAIDAAIQVNGRVVLPQGDYLFSALDFTGINTVSNSTGFGLSFVGIGMGTWLTCSGTAPLALDFYHPTADLQITFQNIQINGNGLDTVDCLRIGQMNRYSTFIDVRIYGFRYGVIFKGNYPTWVTQGLWFYNVNIRGCARSAVLGQTASNLSFRWVGGYIDNCGHESYQGANGGAFYPVLDLQNCGEAAFWGLVVEGNYAGGLRFGSGTGDIRFYACRFEETIQSWTDPGAGNIHAFDAANNLIFRDCYFAYDSAARVGVHAAGYQLGVVSQDVIFDHCRIEDVGASNASPFTIVGTPQISAPHTTFTYCLPVGQRSQETHDFGGSLFAYVSDTGYVDLPDSPQLRISGLADYVLEATITAQLAAPAGDCTLRLYDVTFASAVTGSECVVSHASTNRTRGVSSPFFLGNANSVYKVQVKVSEGANNPVAVRARVY